MIYDLIILAVALFLLYTLATQVVTPLWRGAKPFPWFQPKVKKLEDELTEVRQARVEKDLKQQIREEKKKQ